MRDTDQHDDRPERWLDELLESARVEQPLPPAVSTRLDDVLASLQVDRAAQTARPAAPYRRWAPRVLGAAAALMIGATALTALDPDAGDEAATPSSARDAVEEAAPDPASPRAEPSEPLRPPSPSGSARHDRTPEPTTAARDRSVAPPPDALPPPATSSVTADSPRFTSEHFDQQVAAYAAARTDGRDAVPPEPLALRTSAAAAEPAMPTRPDEPDRPDGEATPPGEDEAPSSDTADQSPVVPDEDEQRPACPGPSTPADASTEAVILDGRPVALVAFAPTEDQQRVAAYTCAGDRMLASTTLEVDEVPQG